MAAIHDIITDSAMEHGIDPAFALSVAERESNFNPYEGGYGTIRGLFQFTRALRNEYGISERASPQDQADAFMRYTKTLQGDLRSRLGRDPTHEELYYAHHFGPGRAAHMVSGMHPDTPVSSVFTPYELQTNPHLVRAGTVGNIINSVGGDIRRRMAKHGGGEESEDDDLGKYGIPLDAGQGGQGDIENANDLGRYGEPINNGSPPGAAPAQRPKPWQPSGPTSDAMPFSLEQKPIPFAPESQ